MVVVADYSALQLQVIRLHPLPYHQLILYRVTFQISEERKNSLHFFYRTKQSPPPASPSKLSQSKIFVETSQSADLFAFKTTAAGAIDIFYQVLTSIFKQLALQRGTRNEDNTLTSAFLQFC